VALIVPAMASAIPTAQTFDPLPGSVFQAGDGDQLASPPLPAAPTLTDWESLQAAGDVTPIPDPNFPDSVFEPGATAKELAPGDWAVRAEPGGGGSNPAQGNIIDGWAAVEQRTGGTFLYLALRRETSTGQTFITFELNHDPRLWDAGPPGGTPVPCRTTGDILATLQFPSSAPASVPEVIFQRWVTTGPTDPGTGCALTGILEDAALTVPPSAVPWNAQGWVNGAEIANVLPGQVLPTQPSSPLAARRFGEVGLNLSAIMEAAGDPCFAYRSVWMHSRSSLSEQANLQDYVAPQRLNVRRCTAAGTKFHDANRNGARDPGEEGLARFVIWADYDDDGVHDPGEPSTTTDTNGNYLIEDIRPPAPGTYRLREDHPEVLHVGPHPPWTCSYPTSAIPGAFGDATPLSLACGWGPIDVATTPNVAGRDFGDHLPPGTPVPPDADRPSVIIRSPGPTGEVRSVPALVAVRGRAALTGPRGCVRERLPIVVRGTRMATLRVFVNGRPVRRVSVLRTQRRVPLLLDVSHLPPGRHRVSVRVTYRLGSGSPPVTLRRPFEVCFPPPPRFTG
jgi:hypothetical protein